MRHAPTRLTRSAAVAAATLAVANLTQTGSAGYLALLLGSMGLIGLLAAVRLWREGCFESRLLTTLVAAGSLLGTLLRATVGLPGTPDVATGWLDLLAAVLAVATVLLLLTDRLRRGPGLGSPTDGDRPYARARAADRARRRGRRRDRPSPRPHAGP